MSLSITSPNTDREAWLKERLTGVGASEAAAALGISRYESPRMLYRRKLGEAPPQEETEVMWWGNELEPLVAKRYSIVTGRSINDVQIFRRDPAAPWRLATVDAIDSDGELVEIKTTSPFARELGEEGTDEIPEHWIIQAHQQMLVFDRGLVRFAVLVGGQQLKLHEVTRNDEVADFVREGVDRFWHGHVLARIEPEVTAADLEDLSRVRPDPGREITLTGEAVELAEAYVEATAREKEAKAARDLAKARLLAHLGEAAVARTLYGDTFTRKVVNVKEQTKEAYSYVGLYHKGRKA